jgi:hypothetical protein
VIILGKEVDCVRKKWTFITAVIVFVFLGATYPASAAGKTVQTVWVFQDPEHDTIGHALSPTKDGGFIATGVYNRLMYLKKINKSGKEEWSNIFPEGLGGFDVKETNDGGFILVGQTRYLNDKVGVQSIVVKTDSQGSLEWQKTFGGYSFDKFSSVIVTDTGYLIGGIGSDLKREGASLIFLDTEGKVIWQKVIDNINGSKAIFVSDMLVTTDGSFIALINYKYQNKSARAAIAKISPKGDIKILSSIPGESFSIEQDYNKGYVVSARGTFGTHQVTRLNSQGKTVWTKTFTPSFSKAFAYGSPYSVTVTKDGNYLVAGDATTLSSQIAYVYKVDKNGKRILEKTFFKTNSLIYDIKMNDDGSFVFIGQYHDQEQNKVSMFLVKCID